MVIFPGYVSLPKGKLELMKSMQHAPKMDEFWVGNPMEGLSEDMKISPNPGLKL
jgi:hypothetical protein